MKRPIEPPREPVELTPEEAERLTGALEESSLSAADRKQVAGLIRLVLWLQSTLQETRIGLSRLKRLLFGMKTEKRPRTGDDDPDGGDGGGTPEGGDKATPPEDDGGPGKAGNLTQSRRTSPSPSPSRAATGAPGRRPIPGPRRCYVPLMSSPRVSSAPCVSRAGCTRWRP